MRPPFNSFRPQARPQQQQMQSNGYSNHQQHHGYQNRVNSNQLGMGMINPATAHMNNPIPMPNMPINPQFFNNHPQQQFALPNNINQLLPSLLGNLQFAVASNNLMNHSMPPNFFQHSQPPQLNSFNPLSYPPVPTPHQNHQFHPPAYSEPRPQMGQSLGIFNNANGSSSKGNYYQNKVTKHQQFNGSGQRFQRSQLHQANNRKRKNAFNKGHIDIGKGKHTKMETGLDGSGAENISKEKKRFPAWVYTPKEIQQWRTARRKNFPSKLNVEKKVKKNVSDEEAKLRRQQLQEVLAKQAELGIEVADVPSHYLSNPDEQVNGGKGDKFQNKGRFKKKRHNKRRHGEKDKFSKKPRLQDKTSSSMTLLEKLLTTDITREKSQLLQVIRFMVMNSFFNEFPEQPLVMVDETGCENDREDSTTQLLCDDHKDDVNVDVNGIDNSCNEAVG